MGHISRGEQGLPEDSNISEVFVVVEDIYVGTVSHGFTVISERKPLTNNPDGASTNQIQGATTHQLIINNLSLDQSGAEYFVQVSKDGCFKVSGDVTLTVLDIPIISSTTPSNEATNIALDSNLEITFNEIVTKGTGNIYIRRTDDDTDHAVIDVTSTSATIDGQTLTIDLGNNTFDSNTKYYVNIDAGIVKNGSSKENAAITDTTTGVFTTHPNLSLIHI